MKRKRLYYSISFLIIIILGILSRKTTLIPLWIGDFLYAVMMYLLIRIFLINKKSSHIAILALFTCYVIEFLQLYQGDWMIEIRKTLFGKYVLGQGFLWSDILAYTAGVVFAFVFETIVLKSKKAFT